MYPKTLSDFPGECRPSGEEINFQYCPVCGDHRWKLYVNPDTGNWFCFSGLHNAGGKIEVGLGSDEAGVRLLEMLRAQPVVPEWAELDLPPWEPLSKTALRYLHDRGVTDQEIRDLGLVEWTGYFRILIPYFHGGDLVFWNSRRYSEHAGMGPKYLAVPGKKPLYFLHASSRRVVLVEGVFDAMAVRRAGFAACALGGKSLPKYLVDLFLTGAARYGIINAMLDSDALAKAFGIRNQLLSKRNVGIWAYPPGKDPAMMTPDEIRAFADERSEYETDDEARQ